ncbi:hypothetical protein Drorol1_Dr00002927 [Drosera rotundifolia]
METDNHDLLALLQSQQQSLTEAKTIQSDLDYAFCLQIHEALTVSAAAASASSSSTPPPILSPITFSSEPDDIGVIADLFEDEIAQWQRSYSDHNYSFEEQQRCFEDLRIRLHDRRFAAEIERIPDQEWIKTGDDYQRPYGEGSSKESEETVLVVYTKGIVVKEEEGRRVVGVGVVVVCGETEETVFEVAKPGESGGEVVSTAVAEAAAAVEGLEIVRNLGLMRVRFGCEKWLYQYVTGKNKNMDEDIAKWVERIHLCQNNFTSCTPFLIAGANNNYAFKLASEAITSQMKKPADNDLKESCFICLEEFVLPKMFTVDGCGHRCCNSCMKKHLEVKLAQGEVPKCPNAGCEIDIKADSGGKLLGPKMHYIMSQLVKEASIPVTDKVYCPDPRCSMLMSRSEVLEFSNARAGDVAELGGCLCIKCQKPFCISCNVPWHTGMTCFSYKMVKPDPDAADTKLKSLATTKKWRQCPKCRHMIELAVGCYHISCKCGNEFCYTCGAEWKDKKATCTCVLWEEHNIVYN